MKFVCVPLAALAMSSFPAEAAKLRPVPEFKAPLPLASLEPNRGQADAQVLFIARGPTNVAVTSSSVLYSPLGVELKLVGSQDAPAVVFSNPLPGVANFLTGPDSRKWISGIPRYAMARLSETLPGVDTEYTLSGDGILYLRLHCRAGLDPKTLTFEIPKAVNIILTPEGTLGVLLGPFRLDPVISYRPPIAFQTHGTNRVDRSVRYAVQSSTRFSFEAEGLDPSLPLTIEMNAGSWQYISPSQAEIQAKDAAGNTYVVSAVPHNAGRSAPFPNEPWAGCGTAITTPVACADVAVHKFSSSGELVFVSYLAGRATESVNFLQQAPDGTLVVTGTTGSADFPVTSSALQGAYAGPEPRPGSNPLDSAMGDFFAAKIDPSTGMPVVSTFFGGPSADQIGKTALGADGSIYFLQKWLGIRSARMPTSSGALKPECDDPCTNGYAARLSPSLDRMLYGTYLPGSANATAELHRDGSVYFTSTSGPGIATTPGAYQAQAFDENDAVIGRLDPTGMRLMFATYVGSPQTEWILRMTVTPEGTLWAHVSSFVQCCIDIDYRLIHLSSDGTRLLADLPIDVGDLAIGPEGDLHATGAGQFEVTPGSFLSHSCTGPSLAYLKIGPAGDIRFATYLPSGTHYDFDGKSELGLPVLWIDRERFDLVEGDMGIYAGCLVDAATFAPEGPTSPGALVTLFGSKMGPKEGVAFRGEDSRLPTVLGGTRVLVNGEPAPLLFVSDSQINFAMPYSLPERTFMTLQVEAGGVAGNRMADILVEKASLSLFRASSRLGPERSGPAAALNQDGTLNSAANPAKPGSIVVLYGVGGGPTNPPSVAGEITPLELRYLTNLVDVQIPNGPSLAVEFAGAAPGLVAGVTQINVKLPDSIPVLPNFPKGVVPLIVSVRGVLYHSGYVTIAVEAGG